MKKAIFALAGAIGSGLLGVALGVMFESQLTQLRDDVVDKVWPATRLERASQRRKLLTDKDLNAAIGTYTSVVERAGADRDLKARAYQGLSRTYADLCMVRFWRGLGYLNYAKLAEEYALKAEKEVPNQPDTHIDLACAYACREAETSRQVVYGKVQELRAAHRDNPDVRFLSWLVRSDDAETQSFSNTVESEPDPSLMAMLEVGLRFAMIANHSSDANQRHDNFTRAEAVFLKAARLFPDHPLVLFRLGYLAQVKNDLANARDFYIKALDKEPNFPRARDNLGTTYSANREWLNAKFQLESAAYNDDALINARLYALHNLGELYLETDNSDNACKAWRKADEISDVADRDVFSLLYRAICSLSQNKAQSCQHLHKSIALGKEQGWDLTNVSTFEEKWKVGPKELQLEKTLLRLCK